MDCICVYKMIVKISIDFNWYINNNYTLGSNSHNTINSFYPYCWYTTSCISINYILEYPEVAIPTIVGLFTHCRLGHKISDQSSDIALSFALMRMVWSY